MALERDKITASVARDAQLAGDHTACFGEFRQSGPLLEPPANFLLVYWLTAMFLQSVPKRQTKHELFAAPPHEHTGPLKQPGVRHRPVWEYLHIYWREFVSVMFAAASLQSQDACFLFRQSRLWFTMLWGSFSSTACLPPPNGSQRYD